jgi:signal transduction histidine kinase
VIALGLAAAAIVQLSGRTLQARRLGASDAEAIARIRTEVSQRLDDSAATLSALARRIGASGEVLARAGTDTAAARELFDRIDTALPDDLADTTGVTIYGATGPPLAWSGQVSDLPTARTSGPAALFIAPGPLGPRLVLVEPVAAAAHDAAPRAGAIVVEQLLGDVRDTGPLAESFSVVTSIVPITLRARLGDAPTPTPYSFAVPLRSGQMLVEGEVSPYDLAATRRDWTRRVHATSLATLAIALLLCVGPLVERRRGQLGVRPIALTTVAVAVTVTAAWALLWAAASLFDGPQASTARLALLACGSIAAAWFSLDLVERRRQSRPALVVAADEGATIAAMAGPRIAVGAVAVWVLVRYESFLRTTVAGSPLDVLRFSLHPLDAGRLGVAAALLLLHASVIWGLVALAGAAASLVRTSRAPRLRLLSLLAWLVGAALGLWLVRGIDPPPQPWLLAVGLTTVAACAWFVSHARAWLRHASQASRLLVGFLALLVPAVAMYPALWTFSTSATEVLIAGEYGPRAANLRNELQERLQGALSTIDAMPSLEAFVGGSGVVPTTDRAFEIWSKTDLARARITSAIELYDQEGALTSRFALSLPESGVEGVPVASCSQWDALEEVSPFGSTERHVLRAGRAVCERGRRIGAIVVRAMLDYRTLPFISPERPYLESLATDRPPGEDARGRDVEFAVYGWSRAPLYASSAAVWQLPDSLFERMVASREPAWDTLMRGGDRFRVHFLTDRGGIYALGYPVLTAFGHAVNLAELAVLCGVLYAALLAGATLLNAATARPASGRALLREVRSSFYRKLFLAFVLVSLVPVLVLALATRAYFAAQFRAEVEETAVQTATVAQRLVEDYATLQERDPAGTARLDDQIMVLVSRAIDQSVHLFDRDRLRATSERDLFASGLLPAKTPGGTYRAIVLDRLPTFVDVEQVGGISYLLAAAPVRAIGREGIVTVPQTLRQQDVERRSDELDRRILFAAVLFVLLGAALGYWMAERIADPVNRLTRATRRIARGDLDARIAATSSDELRRLVEDFNRMAADLKRQRQELERTQRLEAWAEMARQVAHDIKNPLTPIQLSAEHARRVNLDRGKPLSPVLDDCVNAILNQVRLLRQISAEFSSFGSSPVARPERLRVSDLVEEVVSPYRTALSGRVDLRVETAPGLPEASTDRTLFARALTNVIENALHAMPGGGALTIKIAARPETPDSLIVTVTDTGVGMDQADLARIFEPYFSTKASGTGLGLTIAKRNVELIGGSLVVNSTRNVGTTVTITLPVAADRVLEAAKGASRR